MQFGNLGNLGFTNMGLYDSQIEYKKNSLVRHKNAIYNASQNIQVGQEPGIDPVWDLWITAEAIATITELGNIFLATKNELQSGIKDNSRNDIGIVLNIEDIGDIQEHFKIYKTPGKSFFTAPNDGFYNVEVRGAGGGSGGIRIYNDPVKFHGIGGGGQGGLAIKRVYLIANQLVPITIGAGGVRGQGTISVVTDGGDGGASSFDNFCSATGGGGSPGFNFDAPQSIQFIGQGANGGVGINGDLNYHGQPGGDSHAVHLNNRVCPGTGGGGTPRNNNTSSFLGIDGSIPGCGGSGPYLFGVDGNVSGAAGAPGQIVIRWYGKQYIE